MVLLAYQKQSDFPNWQDSFSESFLYSGKWNNDTQLFYKSPLLSARHWRASNFKSIEMLFTDSDNPFVVSENLTLIFTVKPTASNENWFNGSNIEFANKQLIHPSTTMWNDLKYHIKLQAKSAHLFVGDGCLDCYAGISTSNCDGVKGEKLVKYALTPSSWSRLTNPVKNLFLIANVPQNNIWFSTWSWQLIFNKLLSLVFCFFILNNENIVIKRHQFLWLIHVSLVKKVTGLLFDF